MLITVAQVSGVLPLDLLSFKGQVVNEEVSLTWKTVNETNVSAFNIEKMKANTWEKIGSIQTFDGNLPENKYSFSDYRTVSGFNFYRLKILDANGKFAYSDIINIEAQPAKSKVYQNVPNPFTNVTTIKYEMAERALVHIMVFNAAGIQVAVLANEIRQQGSYQVQWNAANVPSGSYYYTVIIGDHVTTKQMLKIN